MQIVNFGKVAIIGAGGQAKETYTVLERMSGWADFEFVGFFETVHTKDEFLGHPVRPISEYNSEFVYHIAIGNEKVRKQIVESLPRETIWLTLVDPSATIGNDVKIGEGSFIGQHSIVTEGVSIGKHTHLNIQCTVSHDTTCGDYMTMAPGARIMGGCSLGENVYIGAASAIRDKVKIANNITIGMGAMVVKDIIEPGTYVGVPAKKLK